MSASYSDYQRTPSETNGDGTSSFEYTFEGTGINIVGNIPNGQVKADIFIDGRKARRIDVEGIDNGSKRTLCRITGLSPGKHTIKFIP
ncbi:hypothetical protein [Thermotoga sp. SG1]|uniref:hypothetical protein n=1 Tax=Thermotoga sp. SG1 TaxID=126739 RepID=UPI00130419FC